MEWGEVSSPTVHKILFKLLVIRIYLPLLLHLITYNLGTYLYFETMTCKVPNVQFAGCRLVWTFWSYSVHPPVTVFVYSKTWGHRSVRKACVHVSACIGGERNWSRVWKPTITGVMVYLALPATCLSISSAQTNYFLSVRTSNPDTLVEHITQKSFCITSEYTTEPWVIHEF